jgi:hypothetical protein
MREMPSFSLKSLTTDPVRYTAQDISNMRVSEAIYDRAIKLWHTKNKAKE